MYVQKSFITNTTFANNTPGIVAQLGELSPEGYTFSREKGYYSDRVKAPNLILTTFLSKDGQTSIVVPPLVAAQTLDICQFVYNQTLSGQTNIVATVMLENLLTGFIGKAGEFECGNMVTAGGHTLPEWLSWKCLADSNYPDNFIKVWFVDASFRQQYDEYEISVIPPLVPLDNFFKPGNEVQQLVDALTSSATMERIQAAKEGYPETIIRTHTYDYINPSNSAHRIPTDWSVLIYGAAGDNVDAIKDALMAYILANSAHTREEWIPIFPDIFKRTEYIVLPLFDQYAIPNRELATGIYSPQVKYSQVVSKMLQYAPQYPEPHIDTHLTLMTHPYRSLALLTIGSPDNRDNKYSLIDVFPDWISVTSTSVDFNRMEAITQEWAEMLSEMLYIAESMGEFTTIPVGMMKIKRNGILYLAKSYRNINYLVVAKVNLVTP